tara:strand:+ start:573 stop:1193 length:621 start_codon:yes stop_codon:yes gene_type:complete
MNKFISSFHTLLLFVIFFSLIFSIFSMPKLKVSKNESIKINFYEMSELSKPSKKIVSNKKVTPIKKNKVSQESFNKNSNNLSDLFNNSFFKKDIKNEISKIQLTKERKNIIKFSSIIQSKISSIWIKPNSLSEDLSAKVLIRLAPSGEILDFELEEPSSNKSFNESILTAMSKIFFFEEIAGADRKVFETNFRNFKLVFKSSGEIR